MNDVAMNGSSKANETNGSNETVAGDADGLTVNEAAKSEGVKPAESPGLQIEPFLKVMAQKGASDLFFLTGAPVSMKVNGKVQPLTSSRLPPGKIEEIAREAMTAQQQQSLDAQHSANFGISRSGVGRFRFNVYRQRGQVAMVIRFIRLAIPTFEELRLPEVLKKFVMNRNGLVLVIGSTGSGKSTTLAAMIDYRARSEYGHILTVEDPIEFLFSHQRSIIGQREVGIDTPSYDLALQDGMREAPDVIMVGEIRSRETMRAALNYADTGHLVLSTLHATSTNQAMDRIINMFPEDYRRQILVDLSINLRAIIGQRLVSTTSGGRTAAVEILANTPYIGELIHNDRIGEIKEIIAKGAKDGMQTFDQALLKLHRDGMITMEEALAKADSRANLEWQLNFGGGADLNDVKEEEEFRFPSGP